MSKLICEPLTNNEWSKEKIAKTWNILYDLAANKYGLELPDLAFEIHDRASLAGLTSAQGGLPTWLPHWTTGQSYLQELETFRENGSRYRILEMIIHSNPCVCYLMAENTMVEQIIVMAHAAVGHADFFHNNYLFKERNLGKNILSYIEASNNFITECEAEYGSQVVETFIDACIVWEEYSYDHSVTQRDDVSEKVKELRAKHRKKKDSDYNRRLGIYTDVVDEEDQYDRNILRYIQKNNPRLETWEKEIIQIFRTLGEYFYPWTRTKTMNEGWAMFWEEILMNDLHEMGHIDTKSFTNYAYSKQWMMRSRNLLESNQMCSCANRPDPYHYGLKVFQDIKRCAENPTEEDYQAYPRIAGTDWLTAVKDACYNYRDQTFLSYYTSTTVSADMGLMTLKGLPNGDMLVTATQRKDSHATLQKDIYNTYDMSQLVPDLSVDVAESSDTVLNIKYTTRHKGLFVHEEELDTAIVYLQRVLWRGEVINLLNK